MRRSILFPVATALLILFAPGAARAAITTAPTVKSGAACVAFDGVYCGTTEHWEGGELWASVVAEGSSTGGLGKKHVANVQATPLVVELEFPPMAPVVAWINDFCAGRPASKSIIITPYDAGGQPLPSTEYSNSLLTEVRFPAFDGNSATIAKITLIFTPGRVQPSPVAVRSSKTGHGVAVNSFTLTIGQDVDGRAVEKIEAFTIKSAGPAGASTGIFRDPTKAADPVASPNLILTLTDSSATSWKAWSQSFLVQGNHLDADEKDGLIAFPNANSSADTSVSLKFSNMGIVRLARIPVPPGNALKDQAEVYFEGLTLTGPASPAVTGSTSTTPAPAAPAAPATAKPTPAATATPATPAAPAGKAADLEPATPAAGRAAAGKTPAIAGADPTASAAPAGADVGPRDPADFPRLSGTVRTVYSANTGKVVSDESATYTTSADFDQVVAFCDSQPKSAGWEETNRSETTRSASGRTMIIDWRKAQKTAQVRLNLLKGGGTEIWLTVTTQHAPK